MELDRFGFDTVAFMADLVTPVPVNDLDFQRELAASWSVMRKQATHEQLGLIESCTAFYQDEANDTIRCFLLNGGRSMRFEMSVPRFLDDSPFNTNLATWPMVQQASYEVFEHVKQTIPVSVTAEAIRYKRADITADVSAGVVRPGLIAAAHQFYFPRVHKAHRLFYPGETGRVSTSQATFRGYDKFLELERKSALLDDLEVNKRLKLLQEMQEKKERGAVRLELALTPKKGGLSEDDMANANIKWADVVEVGFRGGVVSIGGLEFIRREVDGRADLSPQTRNALIAFAVRYAELGEGGMQAVMPRRTFFRHKKKFLDAGLNLDDVVTYSGEIDLRPVIHQVRAG